MKTTGKARSGITASTKVLFVGGLPRGATQSYLRKLFDEKVGGVEKVRFVMDKATRSHRGFGFVRFSNDESVLKAIAIAEEHGGFPFGKGDKVLNVGISDHGDNDNENESDSNANAPSSDNETEGAASASSGSLPDTPRSTATSMTADEPQPGGRWAWQPYQDSAVSDYEAVRNVPSHAKPYYATHAPVAAVKMELACDSRLGCLGAPWYTHYPAFPHEQENVPVAGIPLAMY
eukprot:TRINITY_DN3852_c0_g2_i2.p2 TRINITY_DN3852_c0_g2~~TRINITY_DN3852_c0_g2_i2.p2  ORF type:complete len:233 (+),score=67.41 TRINITY_DN3852_c0_g2_i2:73-771(+)